jgi:DNA-binding HxlR family transcriptional regulator
MAGRRKGYGQFCPVAKGAEVLAERWTPLVLRELLCGSTRFSEIQRGVPLMSPSLLSQRLRELERFGVLTKHKATTGRGSEYQLTDAGRALQPLVEAMGRWGKRWLQEWAGPDDLDPTLLMWDVQRRIDVRRLPEVDRAVLEFEIEGVDPRWRRWWVVVQQGDVDLCQKSPGHEVDLRVCGHILPMVEVWLGRLEISRALRAKKVHLEGKSAFKRSFSDWYQLSVTAGWEGYPDG